MAASATSTVVASLSEPEDKRQRENALGGDVLHLDPNVAQDKQSLKRSSTPESEADTFVVTWDGPDDLANPRNWSLKYRWFVTGLVSLNNLCSYVHIF